MQIKNPSWTAAEVAALLNLGEGGKLYRAVGRGSSFRGGLAGRVLPTGYRQVSIFGRKCLAHRVVWLLVHGEWPHTQIDHINGQRDDNRPENLRLASPSENAWNKHNVKGSTLHSSGKYQSQIKRNGRARHLGLFATPEEANAAYKAAAQLFDAERGA